jgi:hypothetical protein
MMAQTEREQNGLAEGFHQLGQNLAASLRVAWATPEGREFQVEIAEALNSLVETIEDEAMAYLDSAAGKRMRVEARYLQPRGGETEKIAQMQADLAGALERSSAEFRQVLERCCDEKEAGQGADGGTDRSSTDPEADRSQEIHPDDQSAPPSNQGHVEIHPDDVES